MWVVRCKGVVIYMRFFDYIDTIEKPTIENIRVIYKAINEKYDDLIDMALEPNSKNYKKWVQNMECLKKSENMMIDCIAKKLQYLPTLNLFSLQKQHTAPVLK